MKNKKLKFLGIGNLQNKTAGNTSAFYKERNYLLLIDCGKDVFEKIRKFNLLDNVLTIDILITDLTTATVGSLGDLIDFLNKSKQIKPNIYFNSNMSSNLLERPEPLKYTLFNKKDLNVFKLKNMYRDIIVETSVISQISSYKILLNNHIIIYNNRREFYPNTQDIIEHKLNDLTIEYYQAYNIDEPMPKHLKEYVNNINVPSKDIISNQYNLNKVSELTPDIYNGKQIFVVRNRIEFLTSENYLYNLPGTLSEEDILDIITGVSIAEYDKETKTFRTFLPESPEDYEVISWEDVCHAIENNIWLIINN